MTIDIFHANFPTSYNDEILEAIKSSIEETYDVSIDYTKHEEYTTASFVGSEKFTGDRIVRIGMHIGLEVARIIYKR